MSSISCIKINSKIFRISIISNGNKIAIIKMFSTIRARRNLSGGFFKIKPSM